MRSLFSGLVILFALLAPVSARAVFLDCLYADDFDGESTSAPTQWRGNLNVHNCARRSVVPAASPPIKPLVWSSTLATTAQTYANQCVYAHSGAAGLGENIYASAPPSMSQTDTADSFVSEFPSYNYAANTCSGVCGHYTQVVWRGTTSLGCGIANCSANTPFGSMFPNWTFVVCNYSPAGNNGARPY
jgi:pathogenesis-related protein 1